MLDFVLICSYIETGLERQLNSEKQSRGNLEQETTSLKKKITLLEYDLQEAKKSLKQTQNLKDKADLEVRKYRCLCGFLRHFVELFCRKKNKKKKLLWCKA